MFKDILPLKSRSSNPAYPPRNSLSFQFLQGLLGRNRNRLRAWLRRYIRVAGRRKCRQFRNRLAPEDKRGDGIDLPGWGDGVTNDLPADQPAVTTIEHKFDFPWLHTGNHVVFASRIDHGANETVSIPSWK